LLQVFLRRAGFPRIGFHNSLWLEASLPASSGYAEDAKTQIQRIAQAHTVLLSNQTALLLPRGRRV